MAVVGCVRAATGAGRIGSANVAVGDGLVVRTHLDPSRVDEDAASAGTPEEAARIRGARRALEQLTISGGEPAELDGTSVLAPVQNPTRPQQIVALLAALAAFLPLFVGVLLVERMLRRAAAGEAFSRQNVTGLQRLALVVGLGSTAAALIDLGAAEAIAGGRFDGLHVQASFGAGPLVVGGLLLALAEVWRHGLALRDDVEATI